MTSNIIEFNRTPSTTGNLGGCSANQLAASFANLANLSAQLSQNLGSIAQKAECTRRQASSVKSDLDRVHDGIKRLDI